jgi:hypothetical protein
MHTKCTTTFVIFCLIEPPLNYSISDNLVARNPLTSTLIPIKITKIFIFHFMSNRASTSLSSARVLKCVCPKKNIENLNKNEF